MTLLQLVTRRRRLLILQVNLDQELADVEAAIERLRPGLRHTPHKPYTLTPDEAKAAHSRYNQGVRDPLTRRGHSEYQRRWLRAKRAAA